MAMQSNRWIGAERFIAIVGVLAATVVSAQAQERVGSLTAVTGRVTIERSDGTTVQPRMRANRVQQGSVFAGDVLETSSGATASLLLTDGSVLDLEGGTEIKIENLDRKALLARGETKKTLGRLIKIASGDIAARITPGSELVTEFETPSGVAAVKGTSLTISVVGERVFVATQNGLVQLTNSALSVNLAGGFGVTISPGAAGGWVVTAAITNPGTLAIVGTAGTTALAAGGAVGVTAAGVITTAAAVTTAGGILGLGTGAALGVGLGAAALTTGIILVTDDGNVSP